MSYLEWHQSQFLSIAFERAPNATRNIEHLVCRNELVLLRALASEDEEELLLAPEDHAVLILGAGVLLGLACE